MTTRTRRKCRHCGQLFRPDPRNLRHQRYCSAKECRRASKAASQRRWLAKTENRDYFRGPEQMARVSGRWPRRTRAPVREAVGALRVGPGFVRPPRREWCALGTCPSVCRAKSTASRGHAPARPRLRNGSWVCRISCTVPAATLGAGRRYRQVLGAVGRAVRQERRDPVSPFPTPSVSRKRKQIS